MIDINKDKYELPRFPINEKYGDLKRFKFLINLQPLEYKNLLPKEKFITLKNNPPLLTVEFFKDQKNIQIILIVFQMKVMKWEKSNFKLIDNKYNLKITI